MDKRTGALLCAATSAIFATDAWAQAAREQLAAGSDLTNSEIVVTAMRRTENLQSVPASITALAASELRDRRLVQVSDLATAVPNLQASPAAGDGLPIFSLRGVSMSDYNFNQQGPVATYFDEVYKGSFPLLPFAMFDLERVEVLRGPQGTLYGKNTTGGAINFISRKPGFATEGYLKAGLGNYRRYEAEGAVQTALGEKIAARIAFSWANADGWIRNRLPGLANVNAVRQYGVRASVLVQPSDRVNFVLRLSTSLQDPINFGIYARPGPAGVGGGIYELFGGSSYFRTGLTDREIESNRPARFHQRTYGASLTGTWQVSDSLSLTSVSAWDYGNLFIPEDTDGSPLKVLESDYRGRGAQIAQDVRLSSSFPGAFNFIAGAYFHKEIIRGGTTYRYFNDIDVNGDGGIDDADCLDPNGGAFIACQYDNRYRQVKHSAALYSDFTLALGDRFVLRGGLRYTQDRGEIDHLTARLLGPTGNPLANTVPGDVNNIDASIGARFRKGMVSGKLGIDYKLPGGNLLYASFSRGYRANAFNAQAYFSPTELNVARPETVNAYEVGVKSQFMNRRVTLNLAAFYYDYANQQALNVDANSIQSLVNIPRSRIYGSEIELGWKASRSVHLSAGVGLLDTRIRRGVLSGIPLSGNRLPNAAAANGSAAVDWEILGDDNRKLVAGASMNFTTKQYFDLFNTERIAQGSYAILNAQLAWRFARDRFGISVWTKNLLDRHYLRYAFDLTSTFGYDYLRSGDPRTFGLSIDAKM